MDKILEIFVITFNRSSLLNSTLSSLVESIPNCIRINVIDNNSTDNTHEIVVDFINEGKNVRYIKNTVNIGANANILRCFEYCQSKYTWILGDDDMYDLKDFNVEFLNFLANNQFKLIHVGAHEESWDFGEMLKTPNELINEGYPYFKFSSFIGCNIFETHYFIDNFLIEGYNNIINAYPHMPYLFDVYKKEHLLYISRSKFVTAIWKHQNYNHDQWFSWWLGNALTYKSDKDKRAVFLNHFDNQVNDNLLEMLNKYAKENNQYHVVNFFVSSCLNFQEKLRYRSLWLRKKSHYKYLARICRRILEMILRNEKN